MNFGKHCQFLWNQLLGKQDRQYDYYAAEISVDKTYLGGAVGLSEFFNTEPVISSRRHNVRYHRESGEIQVYIPVDIAKNLPMADDFGNDRELTYDWISLPGPMQDDVLMSIQKNEKIEVRFHAA